ncbi:MAG: polysaccharide biosynthesis protein, partial [Gemmatimonadota bacterium]|nr:polysaccharide biosynthesis protein [Gemmatimonadota bacterium]
MRATLRTGFRNRYLLALDLLLLPLATYLAFVVRFEGLFDWREPYRAVAPVYLAATLPLKIALLIWFGMYRRLWRFASVSELEGILLATGVSGLACAIMGLWGLPLLGLIPVRV